VIGASREITSNYVMNKLGLEEDLHPLMAQYGVSKPVDALTAIRYKIYDEMVADPQVLRDNQWSYTVELLRLAKESARLTALTTLSKRKDVMHVVEALDLEKSLDLILTAEDVTKGKPDPEIYLLAAERLKVPPEECLVLEDSVNGVKSGLAAGMNVVAIATPFTNASIHTGELIDEANIVHEPEMVTNVVRHRIEEHSLTAHKDRQQDREEGA
jgi:beta-phosphoglucomutase-like phosphatase (HAD superfamily)